MTEARQTSINAYRSFRSEGTQLERVMAALTECGPLCDAEISNVTGIPRHLVPARRGVLLDRGRVRLRGTEPRGKRGLSVEIWEAVE